MARSNAPSPHAFAVLGLISLGPTTAYGVREVLHRSLRFSWSVSQRLLVGQPAKLAEMGLVEPVPAPDSRAEQRWQVTAAGRSALRRWLGTPVGRTRTNSEMALRILLADRGTLADLRASVDTRLDQLVEDAVAGMEMIDGYLEHGGPFPHRIHLTTAMTLFNASSALGEARALLWLRAELERWDDVEAPGGPDSRARFAEVLGGLRAEMSAAVAAATGGGPGTTA